MSTREGFPKPTTYVEPARQERRAQVDEAEKQVAEREGAPRPPTEEG
ncbi:hypothetical protein ACWDHW_45730 [Streptomyces melanosporofaciens]